MTLLQSDTSNILQGKIPYVPKWPLNIHIRPVLIKNFEIFDINEASKYRELDDYKNIWITIAHNSTIVTNEKLQTSTTRVIYIRDDEPAIQTLTISLHGKTDDHSLLLDEISLTIGIEVTVLVDDIPANFLFFKLDPVLVSENDKPYVAEFRTPIYHYLIENRELILGRWSKELST